MKITVKKIHIRDGEKNSRQYCAVAMAVRDAVDWTGDVCVLHNSVRVNGKWYSLSKKAMEFIKKFDDGEKVKPFSFLIKKDIGHFTFAK